MNKFERELTLRKRKRTLGSLIYYKAPDIVIYDAMRSVMRAQSKVNGRGWHGEPWREIKLKWNLALDRMFPSRLQKLLGEED